MSDNQVTPCAVWCPHNESYSLCMECATKFMPEDKGDGA